MWIASFAWLCLVIGYLKRKERSVHIRLMLIGICTDIALVLYLQVTRSAVQTALKFSLTAFQQIHIGFSTLALLLYFPVLFLGIQLIKGTGSAHTKARHMVIAQTALILRTLGFLFMFSMWKNS